MILAVHPSWSYADLAATPLRVLQAMDALTSKAADIAARKAARDV